MCRTPPPRFNSSTLKCTGTAFSISASGSNPMLPNAQWPTVFDNPLLLETTMWIHGQAYFSMVHCLSDTRGLSGSVRQIDLACIILTSCWVWAAFSCYPREMAAQHAPAADSLQIMLAFFLKGSMLR